jgi:hypothetical protein
VRAIRVRIRKDAIIRRMRNTDVAPTIMQILGVTPQRVDGEVLHEILRRRQRDPPTQPMGADWASIGRSLPRQRPTKRALVAGPGFSRQLFGRSPTIATVSWRTETAL